MNHFCTRYAVFACSFEYATYWSYVKRAALYRTFISQSFVRGNNSNDPVASFFSGVRIRLGTILGRFSIIYFRGLGLRIGVMVWVGVRVRVWVRVGVRVRVSVVLIMIRVSLGLWSELGIG